MKTDWQQLARRLGSLQDDGSELGGDIYAQQALGEILGSDWMEQTVDYILDCKHGSELAMNCLSYLHSTAATQYAYRVYQSSEGDRAARAVWLIKHLANPVSIDWIEAFLNDDNVMQLGLGVLDQLLWTEQIPNDERVKALLELAENKSNGQLVEQVGFIREHLQKRN
jgi:hypothetical protein